MIPDTVLRLGTVHIFVKILSKGTDVHIENSGLYTRIVFFGDYGLLGGIHTADR